MKKALIVGINNYPNCPLSGCENDAIALSELLERNGDGSPNFHIKLKLNVQTKGGLKGCIRELFEGNNDIALFYFSGHGYLDTLGGYIVTPDASVDDVGVSMSEIIQLANKSRSKNKIIILDCCNAGAFGQSVHDPNVSEIGEGVTVLTASKSTESAMEVGGHGIFTNLLLNGLNGGAADLKGCITPGSVYSYIDQALGAWDQRPVFKTNISEFTTLRTIEPTINLSTLRKIKEYFPSPLEEFNLDPSFEDTNALAIDHKLVEPYADYMNVGIFKELQKMQSVGLVEPVGAPFMYFAAMESKSCKLTPLGAHYWRLVNEGKI